MNFMPLLVINILLLVISVILIIADRLLVTYGTCTITVEENEKRRAFTVQGGNNLLAELKNQGIPVTSSCGGKATCGYCKVKVLSGAGPLLPTEEIFMNREEKRSGMRIACTVKVKNDMEIFIPDHLATVRSIVADRRWDPKLRFHFIKNDQRPPAADDRGAVATLGEEQSAQIERIVARWQDTPGALLPVLHEVHTYLGHLPEPALAQIARNLTLPLTRVYRTATFYNGFSLEPRGKHVISVCTGTACHVKGAADVLAALEETLHIKTGQTTPDRFFSLEDVRCIGCCGLAPVVKVGTHIHGLMTPRSVAQLIDTYRNA